MEPVLDNILTTLHGTVLVRDERSAYAEEGPPAILLVAFFKSATRRAIEQYMVMAWRNGRLLTGTYYKQLVDAMTGYQHSLDANEVSLDASEAEAEAEVAPFYVNVYYVKRCYGGPEEGGWYYDAGRLELCEPFKRESKAVKRAQYLRHQYANKPPRRFGLPEGEFIVRIGSKPGASYPASKPAYE